MLLTNKDIHQVIATEAAEAAPRVTPTNIKKKIKLYYSSVSTPLKKSKPSPQSPDSSAMTSKLLQLNINLIKTSAQVISVFGEGAKFEARNIQIKFLSMCSL